MHNGVKAAFTLLVLFENAFKLHSSKGSCNFERIFKYHSGPKGGCFTNTKLTERLFGSSQVFMV